MADVSFSLPSELLHWVDAQIADGRYVDAGDYLRDLVRRHRDGEDPEEAAEMRRLVEEGDASGILHDDARVVLRRVMAGISEPRG